MANTSTDWRYHPIAAEVPAELCHIFNERVTVPKLPLPSQISDAQCNGRQLYTWQSMGYSVDVLALRRSSVEESIRSSVWKERMRNRLMLWVQRNGILSYPRSGTSTYQFRIALATALAKHTAAHWFFGVIGTYDLYTFSYVPPPDQDQSLVYLTPGTAIRQELPCPQDIPSWFRIMAGDKLNLPTFDDWLHQNPAVFEHYFPDKYLAWRAQTTAEGPPRQLAQLLNTYGPPHQLAHLLNSSDPPVVGASTENVRGIGSWYTVPSGSEEEDEVEKEATPGIFNTSATMTPSAQYQPRHRH